METGRTEEETCIERTADRGKRKEGKRKVRKLSNQKPTKTDERKSKGSRKARKRSGRKETEKKGSTCGTAVGVKQGRMKGNKQKAKYQKPEKKYEKPDGR